METERNSHEIRKHRYGVVMAAEYSGEKTKVLGRYETREKMIEGYLLWAAKLGEMDISENLDLVEFNERGERKVLTDILLEIHEILIEEARRRHSLN